MKLALDIFVGVILAFVGLVALLSLILAVQMIWTRLKGRIRRRGGE